MRHAESNNLQQPMCCKRLLLLSGRVLVLLQILEVVMVGAMVPPIIPIAAVQSAQRLARAVLTIVPNKVSNGAAAAAGSSVPPSCGGGGDACMSRGDEVDADQAVYAEQLRFVATAIAIAFAVLWTTACYKIQTSRLHLKQKRALPRRPTQ